MIDLSLPEMLDEGAVALVEWEEVTAASLAPDYLQVEIEFAGGDDERRFELRPAGPAWARRASELQPALGRWRA